jgi:hypothetical protein
MQTHERGTEVTTSGQDHKKALIKSCLLAGTVMHVAGLMVYGRFPFLYLFSIVVLSAGYYLHLLEKQYRPCRMPSFWGIVFVLSIPIVGLIAGFQKMLVIPVRGSTDKPDKKRTTLVTLLLAVPIAVFLAAMILPAFRGTSPVVMKIILVVAIFAELALLIALIAMKTGKRMTGS